MFLKCKCLILFSITDAKRKYFQKTPVDNFAFTGQASPLDSEPLKIFVEKCTNKIVKIIHEAISQQNERILKSDNS